jgi:hypothetical protein
MLVLVGADDVERSGARAEVGGGGGNDMWLARAQRSRGALLGDC